MARPEIDKGREERIEMEIVVDCHDDSERFSGWYYHLEDKLEFPFQARCIAQHAVSPLMKGEEVTVIGMIDEDWENLPGILVQIEWRDRKLGAPLEQLEGIGVSKATAQAIADWRYWCARGYCF